MEQPNFFAIIPANVRYSNVPPNAKLLYGEITALCGKEGYCWATNGYFAKLYDKTESTISVWISHLVKNDFIDIEIEENYKRKIFLKGVLEKSKGGIRKIERGVLEKSNNNNTDINTGNDNNVEQGSTDSDLQKLETRLGKKNEKHKEAIIAIVDHFKTVSGKLKTEYSTKGALKLILHWLNDGKTVEDFKAVIDYKTAEFKKSGKTQYIKMDTYCRVDKFEDTLQETKNTVVENEDLKDCELSNEEAEKYAATRNWLKAKYPATFEKVKFFTYSEFKLFTARNFFPMYRQHYDERVFKQTFVKALTELEEKPWERNKAAGIYPYLKEYLISQIRA